MPAGQTHSLLSVIANTFIIILKSTYSSNARIWIHSIYKQTGACIIFLKERYIYDVVIGPITVEYMYLSFQKI